MALIKREVIVTNKAQCAKCEDIIESLNRHDFKFCKCGSISVDGGKSYLKRSFKDCGDIIEMSETYEEEYESGF
jgi:tRNA(Ile2) C34 agmatinyltransferase TiaS